MAPVYVVAGWSVIQTLGRISPALKKTEEVASQPASTLTPESRPEPPSRVQQSATKLKLNNAAAGAEPTTAFVIAWLATSALQLVTAPLVEPRYFIIPWLIWRLHVPTDPSFDIVSKLSNFGTKPRPTDSSSSTEGPGGGLQEWLHNYDHRLWLETAWFLIINAVTCYVFLYRGFEWSQEPGRVQRFMW